MAVIAHAQHQHVDRRQLGQGLIGLQRRLIQVGSRLVQADKACGGSRSAEQMAAHQAFIAVGMADRYPALVGQADHHLRPGQSLLGQALEKCNRATPAGNHQGRDAMAVDSRTQRLGHGIGEILRQMLAIAVAARHHAQR
ncbi:hypothetical protein D3C86_1476330 [compost metagenome]